jgi:hypothetical protein
MPRFALTFDYPDRHGATVTGSQVVIRDSLEDAVEYIAGQRPGLTSIHIRRRILDDGVEMIATSVLLLLRAKRWRDGEDQASRNHARGNEA